MERPEPYSADPRSLAGLPIEFEGFKLQEGQACRTFVITPFRRSEEKLNRFLQENCGVTLPGSSGASSSEQFQLLWCRLGAYFLVCPPEVQQNHLGELAKLSAINEVSDGWVRLVVSGGDAENLLAREVSVDLALVPQESTFVALFQNMRVHFYKTGNEYHLRIERSLCDSLISKLQQVAELFQARVHFLPKD